MTRTTRPRFHKNRECFQLTKSGSVAAEVNLDEIGRAQPCRTCYPDAPRLASAHRWCRECNKQKIRPCQHNGGVLVPLTRTHRKTTINSDPGDTYIRFDYVWPEQVHLYTN